MDSQLREALRLGRIGYLNVLPVYYPLETGKVPHSFEIVSGIPSHLNELMAQGELDLSPVSSIEYARHPERYFILPNLSISSRSKHEGEVQSVLLLSRQPIDRLDGETIWVSTQSHTSVALLKALFALFLEKELHFNPAACTQANEGGDHPSAFLAIGNEALQLRQHPLYPYHWDLGKAWFDWTGLPFVFALWVIQRRAVERWHGRLDPAVRQEMCEAAVRLIRAANYTNAGTVEFIVDRQGRYYFIEVNARIQVEHPVTELVTGIDLIKAQIHVAANESLNLRQEDIRTYGHAIECRINAEDPSKGFRPSPGTIHRMIAPGGFGVRFDTHIHTGYTVSPHYDSLIGKLLVHQPTRQEAIACMKRALSELRIEGVKTTVPLALEILDHPAFVEARVDTTFIERTWPS